jgi:hypothetical protein
MTILLENGSERPHGTTIRAVPSNTAAGESPKVLFHAIIAYLKTTRALPAKWLFFSTARADMLFFLSK